MSFYSKIIITEDREQIGRLNVFKKNTFDLFSILNFLLSSSIVVNFSYKLVFVVSGISFDLNGLRLYEQNTKQKKMLEGFFTVLVYLTSPPLIQIEVFRMGQFFSSFPLLITEIRKIRSFVIFSVINLP
jgi:hypothetical protein